MKFDNKFAYRAITFIVTCFALVGAVLAAFDVIRGALILLGLSLSLIPVLGHLRMREQLSAIRRIPQSPGGSFDSQPLSDQLSSLERRVALLAEAKHSANESSDELISAQIQEAVNQLRRESRMARIAAAQITGKL